ncbi:MAG: hypothetical protein K2M44_03110 [Clostridia bacterium]|nr:hypothetical protein [Clostridia bacterium]
MIFTHYSNGNDGENWSEDENSAKEKETDKSVSLSERSYTPVMVHRFAAKKNIAIYKVNRRDYYCGVDLPLSGYQSVVRS